MQSLTSPGRLSYPYSSVETGVLPESPGWILRISRSFLDIENEYFVIICRRE